MRGLFEKITHNKGLRLLACLLVALPVWAIITFTSIGKPKEVKVDAVPVEITENVNSNKENEESKVASENKKSVEEMLSKANVSTDIGEEIQKIKLTLDSMVICQMQINKSYLENVNDENYIDKINKVIASDFENNKLLFPDGVLIDKGDLKNENGIDFITGNVSGYEYKAYYNKTENKYMVVFGIKIKDDKITDIAFSEQFDTMIQSF